MNGNSQRKEEKENRLRNGQLAQKKTPKLFMLFLSLLRTLKMFEAIFRFRNFIIDVILAQAEHKFHFRLP